MDTFPRPAAAMQPPPPPPSSATHPLDSLPGASFYFGRLSPGMSNGNGTTSRLANVRSCACVHAHTRAHAAVRHHNPPTHRFCPLQRAAGDGGRSPQGSTVCKYQVKVFLVSPRPRPCHFLALCRSHTAAAVMSHEVSFFFTSR